MDIWALKVRELSYRARNALAYENITDIYTLKEMLDSRQFRFVPNVGKTTLREVSEWAASFPINNTPKTLEEVQSQQLEILKALLETNRDILKALNWYNTQGK